MRSIRLHGASYSVYTRIPRLVMEECGVSYTLVETDIFAKERLPADYLQRHPFSKIPVLEHGDFWLFETDAIVQYLTGLFDGSRLLPETPEQHARCLQVMRICDNYAYPRLVWGVFVPERERAQELTTETLAEACAVLAVLENFLQSPFFLGDDLTLADFWVLPMLAYFKLAPSGPGLLGNYSRLTCWFDRITQRSSVRVTRFPDELKA